MLGIVELSPEIFLLNTENISANYVNEFDGDLQKLLESLKNEAAAGGSLHKFAEGNASAPNFMTLYALVY